MELETTPIVSVIVPVYNGEAYLEEALASALAQTWPHKEIVVVDDGSTDRTAEIAKANAGVRYAYQENAGTGPARNLGIRLSTGPLLAFLDADDLWLPNKLELQVGAFQAKKDLDVVSCYVENFFSPELDPEWTKNIRIPEGPLPGHLISALMIRHSSMPRLGEFATSNVPFEFIRWFIAAKDRGMRISMLEDVLVRRRIHQRNQGILRRQELASLPEVLKASLDRRRGSEPSSDAT